MMYPQALHFNPKLCAAGANLAQLHQSLAERKSEAPVSAAAINQLTDTLQRGAGSLGGTRLKGGTRSSGLATQPGASARARGSKRPVVWT